MFSVRNNANHDLFKIRTQYTIIDLVDILQDTHITTLNLSWHNIGSEGAIALANALKDTHITTLDLTDNNIRSEGAIALANVLKDTHITTLNLGWNQIGDEGAIALANALKDTHITTLDFSRNNIETKGAIALANALKDTHITTLGLRGNYIGDEGAIALANALKDTHITTLDLGWNQIGDEGITALNNALTNYKYLISLNLDYYNIKNIICDSMLNNIKIQVNNNRLLVKKLVHFLIDKFDSEDNLFKKISAVRFYKKVDKTLFTQFLQEENQDLKDIVHKVKIFTKDHAWTIAGISKKIEPELVKPAKDDMGSKAESITDDMKPESSKSNTHISDLPPEMIYKITSYLEDSKWGIEAEVALSGFFVCE